MCAFEGDTVPAAGHSERDAEAVDAPARFRADARSLNWRQLMIRAQAGDDQAYDRLLRDLSNWLQAYFRRRLPQGLVEDAVQDTLAAIHVMHATYQPERPFGPWLAAIARYKWVDALRQRRRHAAETLEDEAAGVSVKDHGYATCSALILNEAIGRLKAPQASAIRLVKIEGASIEEASRLTGQSASLVKVNIHRGLRKISEMLETPAMG